MAIHPKAYVLLQEMKQAEKEQKKIEFESLPIEQRLKQMSTTQKSQLIAERIKENEKLKIQRCRICGKYFNYNEFYEATNNKLDTNGRMSLCKTCINKLVKDYYIETGKDWYKTFHQICRDVDVRYDEVSLNETMKYFETKATQSYSMFSKYLQLVKRKSVQLNIPIRYVDTEVENEIKEAAIKRSDKKELLIKWGDKWSETDLLSLENLYNEYAESYGANGPSERDTLITLCILLIRQKADPVNGQIQTALKVQYDLMGISPDKMKKESKDSSSKILGLKVAEMELKGPAEVIEDKKLFFDYDGLQRDIKDLKRAIKNYETGSRDFCSEGVDVSEILKEDTLEVSNNE